MADEDATTERPAAVAASSFEAGASGRGGESPATAPTEDDPFAERPEVYVGAAFAGGFVGAEVLGELGGDK